MSQLPAQWAMFVGALVLGLAWGPLLPLLNTVIQRKIPANKRGRVFALEMAIWNAGPLISMVAVGSAVDGFGIRPTYTVLALTVLTAGLLVSFNRHIKSIDAQEEIPIGRFATESMISVGRNGYLAISASSEMPVLTRMV